MAVVEMFYEIAQFEWTQYLEHFDGFHNEVKLNSNVPNKINALS